MTNASISALYRHPVKGLSPEIIPEAHLLEGAHFPDDRLFAIENGPSGFDFATPEHMPKFKFLMLMRHERLARLETRFDPHSRLLSVLQGGIALAKGSLDTSDGRAAIINALTAFMGDDLRGELKLLEGPAGFRFMDSRSGFVSILNLASVAAIAALAGRENLDARRFRANIHVSGWQPWAENDLVGTQIAIGEAKLEVIKRIDRCAAVDVAPGAGLRDTRLVQLLERELGHHDCGIYARVIRSGMIRTGDTIG